MHFGKNSYKKPVPRITVEGKSAEQKVTKTNMLFTKPTVQAHSQNRFSPRVQNRTIRVSQKLNQTELTEKLVNSSEEELHTEVTTPTQAAQKQSISKIRQEPKEILSDKKIVEPAKTPAKKKIVINLDYQQGPIEQKSAGSFSRPKGDFQLYKLEGTHLVKRNPSGKSQKSPKADISNLPQLSNVAQDLPAKIDKKQRSTSLNTKLILLKVDSVVKKGVPAARVGRFEAEL